MHDQSLSGKQRVLRKQGNELTERDNVELQKVTQEMAGLQKYLDNSRKMYKQHMAIIQVRDYAQNTFRF